MARELVSLKRTRNICDFWGFIFGNLFGDCKEMNKVGNFSNLETGRYKTCGHGHPYYDESGHYDEVACDSMKGFCGDDRCPLDGADGGHIITQEDRNDHCAGDSD